jgi:hypothetical protein
VKARSAAGLLALGFYALNLADAAAAEPKSAPAEPAAAADLQSPEQRDTRGSAYSLPGGMWAFNVGALGLRGGEAFAKVGIGYGFGARVQGELNLAHLGVGLLNVAGSWQFLDTRHFDLGVRLGLWYGHGDWFWIVGGLAKELVSKLDVLNIPLAVTASVPASRWVAFDLGVEYVHGEVFGEITGISVYRKAQLGVRQLTFQPGVRFFVSRRTELDVSSILPAYTGVPTERSNTRTGETKNFASVPFSEMWSLALGVRSRFADGLFGSIRLHYGEVTRGLYGAALYPSFNLEYRL